jgi:dipeptidyl aminopeptidase/acylaminoacyl peptidase
VREDHSRSDQDCTNDLVAVDSQSGEVDILATGRDFYGYASLTPDGSRLAWLEWEHPNMPWDGSELWTATVGSGGALEDRVRVAGGPEESIYQPLWSPDGVLHFISDRSGFWNLYRQEAEKGIALHPLEADFGRPQWVFGSGTYAFVTPRRVLCAYTEGGIWSLAFLDIDSGELERIQLPFADYGRPRVRTDKAFVVAAGPSDPMTLIELDLRSGEYETLRRTSEASFEPGYISHPEPIEFETAGGDHAYALYYPPANPLFEAGDETPPLLVDIHGGPTAQAPAVMNLEYLWFTSRGVAVVDVNYRGSTGYGRRYQQQLKGNWGIYDVDDAVNAAAYLVDRGDADPNRVAIRGGSAGGYTTLAALAFRDYFRAGASYFGVSDIERFDRDTHKFESRYCTQLIGGREHYAERSPINSADRISAPLILFQGLEDHIVPPSQAEVIVEDLKRRQVPYAYIGFEGEGHGFRRAENVRRSLEAEAYFYSKVFGFELADELDPVEIENLPG